MADLKAEEYKSFEGIKHLDKNGSKYWLARELAEVLQYSQWRNFQKVTDRAMLACKNSGFNLAEHFSETSKAIEMPSKPRKNQDKIGFAEVSKTKNILDYNANLFRISQTEEKLKMDEIDNPQAANNTHYAIAEKIRKAMIDMGTTLPEDMPTPDKSIQIIEREEIRKLRESKKPLMLDE